MAAAVNTRAPSTKICLTNEMDLWLVNEGSSEAEIDAGEIMGFNIGSFKEIALSAMAIHLICKHVFTCAK